MSKPKHLPDFDQLIVDEIKLTTYLLNASHEDGASKARFFLKRGFKAADWKTFAKALMTHGANQTVTDIETTKHGKKFTVECRLETPDGKNPCILSVRIQAKGKAPRLVTAHPNS
jgi:hypothetical protein